MQLKNLLTICLLALTSIGFSQTKWIAHRSHSGKDAGFLLLEIPDNLGLPSNRELNKIEPSNIEPVKIVPETIFNDTTKKTSSDKKENSCVNPKLIEPETKKEKKARVKKEKKEQKKKSKLATSKSIEEPNDNSKPDMVKAEFSVIILIGGMLIFLSVFLFNLLGKKKSKVN